MNNRHFILIPFLLLTNIIFGQDSKFKIITQDVRNFWEAMDSLKTAKDTTEVFQTLVIDRASEEFKVFIRKWQIKAAQYSKQIKRYPDFYKSIRKNSIYLINSEDSIRKIAARFEKLYPDLHPADICIGFGNFSTGGNISIEDKRNLVYIGLEFHGLDSTTVITELSSSIQDYVSRSNFFRTIIHEIVHIQHRTHGKKISGTFSGNRLVNRILSEGIADFIAQLVVPMGNNGNYYSYGILHEKELKLKLKKELFNSDQTIWFGGNDSLFKSMPRDLGYFMGSRIGLSYYNVHSLHNSNLRRLIEITDLERFIHESKYIDEN